MRHVFILLPLASLNACTSVGGHWSLTPEAKGAAAAGLVGLLLKPPPPVRLEGKVTAADDGSPIPGISIVVWQSGVPVADTRSDASGRYSLSFETEGVGCENYHVNVFANPLFFPILFRPGPGCTDRVQTMDFQLERRPT